MKLMSHFSAGPRMLQTRTRIGPALAAVLAVLGIASLAAGPIMSRVEQPDYKVTASQGSIEIRDYGPMIAAEAQVDGERTAAIQEGFRLVSGYFFGANSPNARIAMTAPVQQQKAQTIAMTAPVTQQSRGNSWTVRFIMPAGWTMETLPAPNDMRVVLKLVPAKRLAVIQFSGRATDTLISAKTDELRQYAAQQNLLIAGEPVLAFYNPPWTLPYLRRNEIMIEVAPGQ